MSADLNSFTDPNPVDTSGLLDALSKEIAAGIADVQSPYLYIQAAGSDGSDGSARGIHLRWDFLRSLGEKHMPKGNLAAGPSARYPAPYGFNKADDFVTVWRVPYGRHYPCTVNFSTDRMVATVETGATRWWKFNAVVQGTSPPQHIGVVIRFVDIAQYDTIRGTVDPLTATSQFLARYAGIVEAEVTNQLCFALTLTTSALPESKEGGLRVEAISVDENLPGADLFISCRKRFPLADPTRPAGSNREVRVSAENVRYFRFDYKGCTPMVLQLETYQQFIAGSIVDKTAWEVIGAEFSVTDHDDTVYDRLEDKTLTNVDRKWPRYLGADPASGLFTTSVPNYKAKWDPTRPPTNERTDGSGLRRGVVDYLTLSMNPANATALASLPAQDPNDKGAFEISYLRMLKLIALDFHVARMLGLASIDASIPKDPATKHVYLAVYRTTAALEEVSSPAIVLPVTLTLNPGATAPFPVGLSTPAGANGAFVTLISSNPAIVTVSPANVFIPAGKMTSTLPTLKSIGVGSATISVSAPGFAPASTKVQVQLVPVPTIGLPTNITLKLGEAAPFPVTLSAPVPGDPTERRDILPRTHIFMTLPTSPLDYRLPPAPVQRDPTFGISFDNGTGTSTELTDVDGYTPFDDSRIVNLHLEPYDTVQELGPFFVLPTEFCSSDVTKPVFYGCKYKLVGEPNYRVPEISNDPEYPDHSGVAEVAPLLPQVPDALTGVNRPVYTHGETENGKHEYAFYGVNWFSRSSALSNSKDVDTLIPKRSTLLPPANLAVQLIQPEDPLILTTPGEQQKLAGLSGDSTLIRCTFDWNQNHYVPQKVSAANLYADKVQFCFRQQPPRAVQGEIKSVTSTSNEQVEVRTQSCVLTSIFPKQTVTPAVVPGDEARFVGSSFAANQALYVVEGVAQSTVVGEGAVFSIRKQTQPKVDDLNNNNQQSTSVQVKVPSVSDRFLVVENMNKLANWGVSQPLAKEVTLVNFLDRGQLHTETVFYPDRSKATFPIGGIQQMADIVELLDLDDHGIQKPNSKTGIFEITFNAYQLAPHPDADVEWYKGSVRVPEAATDATKPFNNMKPLDVWKIDVSGTTLKLTAHDPTFNLDPLAGYRPIKTGPSVSVNFHPGYRVYLKAQVGMLDQTTVLPDPKQSTRQTFLAARSRNTALTIESNLTTPVVMQARKVTTTKPPDELVGPLFATRPDFYGKATWTMDVKVTVDSTREPYALVFYRANERAVLDTLYKPHPADGTEPAPDTSDGIEAALKALPAADAAFAANRWRDLVNVQNLHSNNSFNEYTPGGYRFPKPNNAAYVIPGTTIAPFDSGKAPGDPVTFTIDEQPVTMLDVVKGAIEGVFLPLTESPVIYQFIKTGTQTSSKKPVMRNSNGDLLPFNADEFDPSPMAVKRVHDGDTLVRFTDYKLDGAAKNTYFYYAVEMSDQLKLSPRSPIAGPIKLVNAYPAEAPAIRKVTSIIKDSALQIPTGVKLFVNAYLAAEGITKFNLYRATNANDAAATRTMKLVGDYDAAIGLETEIFDDFSDLDFLPFGDPIFYRVVALREIVNERNTVEFIPSQPSTLARASIIDVDNPLAPSLVFNSDPPTMSQPVQLANVVLSWPKVTHNATYYLYKQNGSGNWNKIHQEKTDANPVIVPLSATDLGTGVLLKQDAGGMPIYHRFKVDVENTSGMFNLNENVLSVPATCIEGYSFVNVALDYADDFQPASPLSDRLRDPAVSRFPGSMTFKDIITSLPTAHVFDRIEIRVADGLGHAAKKTINTAGGAVIFQHNENSTGLVLDGSATNVDYAIRVKVFTDSCQDGLLFSYKLRFGPQIALMDISNLLSYTDSATTTSPLKSFVASGVQFPTQMSFTDITVVPAGHSFVSIDIQVQDDQGASFSRKINAAGGTVTFNHADGGLALDASAPNRTYMVSARLFTDLSPKGILFEYSISYS